MQRFLPAIIFTILVPFAAWYGATHRVPAQNPDPNHTHADLAIWVNGTKLDLTDNVYMSGSATEAEHKDARHTHLHLHDSIGHVIHRHKPGLSVGEFLTSIGFAIFHNPEAPTHYCLEISPQICGDDRGYDWRAYANGQLIANAGSLQDAWNYSFSDGDALLLIFDNWNENESQVRMQRALDEMTDDACLYSRTCPWRGDPPTENCIADPKVPCVIPAE